MFQNAIVLQRVRRTVSARKRKVAKSYTKGELNKLIDSLCHPLFKTDKSFILVDGLLHGLVEQNPPTTIRKFIKYNLPTLIKQLETKSKDMCASS